MDREIVVQTWLWRGIEDFYLAFALDEGHWRHYQPLFNYMGLEMFCKAYILAERHSEYKVANDQDAKRKIDKIAKNYSHGLRKMLLEINNLIGDNKVNNLISADYDSFTGDQIINVLEAAYIEIRYPVPEPISKKFPIEGTNLHWYPLLSSGLSKFAYSVGREILCSLKNKFGINISKNEIEKCILVEESGIRFCRLFFNDTIEKYAS
ncbi:hypothetical protein HZA75_05060 [Candidatus Roizmanbacteria bacterium]|nr:hypothetical protein [Candidatus Roizmanbacteria bacterium]